MRFLYLDGRVHYPCAREGHKLDSLRQDDRVCMTIMDQGYLRADKWGWNVRSVILFGRSREIEDQNEALAKLRLPGLKHNPADLVEEDLKTKKELVRVLELQIEHMTGKLTSVS